MGYMIYHTQITYCSQYLFCFCCEGYSNETSGLCGSLLLGTGFVGAIASGILAEKTGKMEQIAKAGETLNGQCHEKNIFFKVYTYYVISNFWVCADYFQNLSEGFYCTKQLDV
jgi:hypothetical protein